LQDRADIPHTLFRNCDPESPLRFLTILRSRTRMLLHNGAMRSAVDVSDNGLPVASLAPNVASGHSRPFPRHPTSPVAAR
jgi:hypothetical protein